MTLATGSAGGEYVGDLALVPVVPALARLGMARP